MWRQVSTGEVTQLGGTKLYTSFAPSPDARFLLVAWLERPFSYTVPCGRFPKRVQLWDRSVCSPVILHSQSFATLTVFVQTCNLGSISHCTLRCLMD